MNLRTLHLLPFLLLVSCQSAIDKATREASYSAYEFIGVEKRDLFKRRIKSAQEEQKEAGEEFKDALERLKSVYNFEGGELEKRYNSLKSSFDNSEEQAKDVRTSIKKMNDVAKDLFDEWADEIKQIESSSLRAKSRKSLADTKEKYKSLYRSLTDSEKRMDRVLKTFRDHVLYLKHNLNAQAIGSLKNEAANIQTEIEALIQEMNSSMGTAETFIRELP